MKIRQRSKVIYCDCVENWIKWKQKLSQVQKDFMLKLLTLFFCLSTHKWLEILKLMM